MAGFWERELIARRQREAAEQRRAAEAAERRRQQQAEEQRRAADAARLQAQAQERERAAAAERARQAAMSREVVAPATKVVPEVQQAQRESYWQNVNAQAQAIQQKRIQQQQAAEAEREALRQQAQARADFAQARRGAEAQREAAGLAGVENPFGVTGRREEAPTDLEYYTSRGQLQRDYENVPDVVRSVLFGEQKESVLGGEAGKLESFLRTQAGEDEFRTAGQRFGERRIGAGIGWGLLGLAGAVPFFGDIVQGATAASRATRAAGAAGDVARGATNVVEGVESAAAPLITEGRLVLQSGEYLQESIRRLRSKVESQFSLEETGAGAEPIARNPSDAVQIFDEIIGEYAPRLVNNPMGAGGYVSDFNRATGINNAISDEIVAEISRRLNVKPNGAVARVTPQLAEQFAETISSLDVTVATDLNGLTGFLQTGRYGNAFEMGKTGSGGWFPEYRAGAENVMFGIPENAPASARPVYGFLSRRPGSEVKVPDDLPGMRNSINPNMAQDYGNIRLRFGPSASNRSTMTAGDSIRRQYAPVPISDPSIENISIGNMNRINGNTYIETQTPGGFSLDELVGIDVPVEMVEQVRAIVGERVPIFAYSRSGELVENVASAPTGDVARAAEDVPLANEASAKTPIAQNFANYLKSIGMDVANFYAPRRVGVHHTVAGTMDDVTLPRWESEYVRPSTAEYGKAGVTSSDQIPGMTYFWDATGRGNALRAASEGIAQPNMIIANNIMENDSLARALAVTAPRFGVLEDVNPLVQGGVARMVPGENQVWVVGEVSGTEGVPVQIPGTRVRVSGGIPYESSEELVQMLNRQRAIEAARSAAKIAGTGAALSPAAWEFIKNLFLEEEE